MFVMKDRNPQRSVSAWVELLKDGILVADVDDGTVAALCCHLADLEVLEKMGEDEWKLILSSKSTLTVKKELGQRLNELCLTEQGFALRYFLKNPPASPHADEFADPEPSGEGGTGDSGARLLDRKTSNLSNLQIVKKYGRQVQSFIELEKKFTDKLVGLHTTLKEARKLFNFILSRVKQKTEPRPWEQLSRRRHK